MLVSEIFVSDCRENQRLWQRHPANPVIPCGDPWCPEFVAPCSATQEPDGVIVYAEGGTAERESIGAYRATGHGIWGACWEGMVDNPLLSPSSGGFDRGGVFDPSVIEFGGALRMYYSAVSGGAHDFGDPTGEATGGEWVGMAVPGPSGRFERSPSPVLLGRCPGVIEWQGDLYMFYVKMVRGGFRVYVARSSDGASFAPVGDGPVLDVGPAGSWDSFTVTTPKVVRDGDHFVMLYAGDAALIDDPTGIGLAVSEDLVSWRKHPGNPVLVVGGRGEFDSVSVAAPLLLEENSDWYLVYAGSDRSLADGYHAQIGMARLEH